jgi:mannosyltransferase PIG-V
LVEIFGMRLARAGVLLRMAQSPLAAAAAVARRWLARADVRVALLATLALRLLTAICVALPVLLVPEAYPWRDPLQPDHFHLAQYPSGLPHPDYGLLDLLTQPWNRWDTRWYLDIAQNGYAHYGTSAFLPLYPLLVRGVSLAVGGNLLLAALVVSTGAAFATFVALYQIAERLVPVAGAGRYAVAAAATAPLAFLLLAGYTESLFLALSLWAMLAALDGAWWRFAALAALAALTRQQGVLLALLPAWSGLALLASREQGARVGALIRRVSAGCCAAAVAPLVAYALWLAALGAVWHAPPPWQPLSDAHAWVLRFTWPGSGILADVAALGQPGGAAAGVALAAAVDLGAVGVSLALLVMAARRFPTAWLLYFGASLLASLTKVHANGLTASEARYMLALLPLMALPAGWLARGEVPRRLAWVGVCALAQMLLLLAFVLDVWVP